MDFHSNLKNIMKEYAHLVYDVTEKFPKSEMFGITSQIRRSSLSVLLNYTEGYARQRKAFLKQFTETSYASLKESLVTLEFAYERKFLNKPEFEKINELGDKIGKMLWGILSKIN